MNIQSESRDLAEFRELIYSLSPEKLEEALFMVRYVAKMTKEQEIELDEMMQRKDFKARKYAQYLMTKEKSVVEAVAV